MGALIEALPAQMAAAWRLGRDWAGANPLRRPSQVVVFAMGGSAVGADLAAALAVRRSSVPVRVIRGYHAPPLPEDALVIACSTSGNTEEVLAAFAAATVVPGTRSRLNRVAITTGGRLSSLAERSDTPVLRFEWRHPPRAGFGYAFMPLLAVLCRSNALAVEEAEVREAIAALEADARTLHPGVPLHANRAKQLAVALGGSVTTIFGPDLLAVPARRWATQIAENAKQLAFDAPLPESHHNLIAGLDAVARDGHRVAGVVLDGPAIHPRDRVRARLTSRLLGDAGVEHHSVCIDATAPLEAMVRACYLGDWVSYYLAALAGVDPTPIARIDSVKALLADPALQPDRSRQRLSK